MYQLCIIFAIVRHEANIFFLKLDLRVTSKILPFELWKN